jgi:alpha-tubulin suppressor-like RCC1 family protein
VGLGSGVVAVGAGFAHSCAVLSSGGVRCWGNNFHGQIGDGTAGNVWTAPRVVTQLSGATAISSGDWHNCARLASGGVRCWGENLHGQLGNGQSGVNQQSTPVAPLLNDAALGIAAGATHTCALLDNLSVQCWGRNTYGQLGTGAAGGLEETPAQVSELVTGVATIAAGGAHTCATTVSQVALCWGRNEAGQLGDGTTTDHPAPAAAGPSATAITAGEAHTCTSRPGGVVCWGRNDAGQLGRGNTVSPGPVPKAVPELASSVGGVTDLVAAAPARAGFAPVGFAVFAALAMAAITLASTVRRMPG